jgi:hypothetical protein
LLLDHASEVFLKHALGQTAELRSAGAAETAVPTSTNTVLFADQRWIGNHGIGRFARHVLEPMDYAPVLLKSNPAAPLDCWRLAQTLSGLNRADVFFSPGYNTPLFCRSPFVFTIHDLSHVCCPENSSPMIRLFTQQS